MTKTGNRYENEELTPMFTALNSCNTPSQYKELETEQLLKVKLPAITYSRQTEIPVSQSQYIWNKKRANVDCIENIVSLCPTCHRAIHHGELDVKLSILKKLYDQKKEKLAKVGLDIDFETLLKFYL